MKTRKNLTLLKAVFVFFIATPEVDMSKLQLLFYLKKWGGHSQNISCAYPLNGKDLFRADRGDG